MPRQKLVVENKAEELIAETARLLGRVRHHCSACTNLEKSADSVYFNIGEGAALFKPRLKASKYDIARGEANEVAHALRALVLKRKLRPTDIATAEQLADHIIAMLTTMIRNLETRP